MQLLDAFGPPAACRKNLKAPEIAEILQKDLGRGASSNLLFAGKGDGILTFE